MARPVRDLRRIGIYPYRKGISVFYDKRSKQCYTVPNEDINKFELINSRYVMGIMVAILAYYFLKLEVLYCVLLGIAAIVALEVYFRMFMLRKYDLVKKPDIGELYNRKKELQTQLTRVLLVKAIAYVAGSVGIFVYLILYTYPIEQEIAIAALALYAFYNGIINASVYLQKRKNKQ